MPSVQNRSLTASGTPPSGELRSTSGGVTSPETQLNAFELVGQRALAVGAPQLAGVDRAGAHALGGLGGGELEQLAHASGEAPGLGTRKPSGDGSGAAARTTSRGSEGRGSSARRAFSTSTTCEVGGHVGEVAELPDLLDVVEDARELLGHRLELRLGQLEAGEAGDVQDLVTAQHAAAGV